jgi:O-antigen/teichoic acid export membrane protein
VSISARLTTPVRRDTIIMLAAQSFYRLSGFIVVMVLARSLPAATIGTFVFAMAFAESFVAISNFGMSAVISRSIAADSAEAAKKFSVIIGFRLVSGVVYVTIVTLAALMFTSAPWTLMLAATLIVLVEDTYYSFGALFLALRKAVYNVTLGVTVQILFIAIFLVGMYLRPSLSMLVAVNAFRVAALLIGAAWVTQRKLFRLAISWDNAAVRAALPFVAMAVVNALRDQIGAVMLGFLSSYDAVAHYNLVSRISVASLAIPTAISAVLSPLIVAHGLDARNRKRLLTATIFILGAALTGSAIVIAFPSMIAAVLYGPLAPQTAPLVPILSLIFPVSFLALFCSLVLQALYRERHVLRTMIVVAASNIALNFALIPQLGAKGALYAQLVATTIQLAILAWDVKARLATANHV